MLIKYTPDINVQFHGFLCSFKRKYNVYLHAILLMKAPIDVKLPTHSLGFSRLEMYH